MFVTKFAVQFDANSVDFERTPVIIVLTHPIESRILVNVAFH